MKPNYPNPFNGSTLIEYELPRADQVQVAIFDAQGQLIELLKRGQEGAGRHQLLWQAGQRASGPYFYQVTAGRIRQARKMLLLQ